jgi:C1A family cysteine protease
MFTLASISYTGNQLVTDFNAWKVTHTKKYDSASSEASALAAFASNDAIIKEHNEKGLSYQLGHNKYSDMTWDEFHATVMNGGLALNRAPKNMQRKFIKTGLAPKADAVDWVTAGAVTKVKDQARCGSCWAFSTTGSVEGGLFINEKKLVSLSEEDLVQCDKNGDQGCQGGLMDNAFEWIEKNGICSEEDYPYTSGSGTTGTCQKGCTPVATLTGFKDVPAEDEDALLAAIAKQPVSVAIEADKSAFQLYKSGVLDSALCGKQLDHGVLAVGYGTDGGKDYYKVKNSWGATWGENGYVRMVQGKNMCGIASQASYPTGVKSAKASLAAAPSGSYCGKVPVILEDKLVINGDGTADFNINVKIAKQVVDCHGEKITVTDSGIHFTDIASDGDCMGDALRGQGKDPTKYFMDINSDGSLTFHSDGYPDLKMTSC